MPIYKESICYEFRPSERDCIVAALHSCANVAVPVDDEVFDSLFPARGRCDRETVASEWVASAIYSGGIGTSNRHIMRTNNDDHIALSAELCSFLREHLRAGRRRVEHSYERRAIRDALDWIDFALVAFHEFGDICRTVECPVCGFATQPCDAKTRMCTSCSWVGVRQ